MFLNVQNIGVLAAVLAASADAVSINKRADICGTKGYDRGKGNYFYDDDGKYNSYSACSNACTKDTKCKSFGYSSSECMLFNVALSGNFDADRSSTDVYYDRGCLSAAASSTTSKSSTSSSATMSSTKKTLSTTAAASSTTLKSSTSKAGTSSTTKASASTRVVSSTSPGTPSSTSQTPSSASTPSSTGPVNPYESLGCPLPKALVVTGYNSTSDANGNTIGSLKVTYGNGTFSCPDVPNHCSYYNGLFDCNCDPDGLTRVQSDGKTWLQVSESYWCDAQEQRPNKAIASWALTANLTTLGDYISYDKASNTYTQAKPITIPVDAYLGGGIIGFAPIDINGTYLPNCPERNSHNPVVTDPATCT